MLLLVYHECNLHVFTCFNFFFPGDGELCVAHITDEGVYLLEPQRVTPTHVVFNVTHLSLFGLLWKIYEYLRPTSGQVLLFRQPPGRRTRKLSLLMLPGNVHLGEVKYVMLLQY